MSSQVNEFLARFGVEGLQHALEAGSSGPVKKDAPKGDGKGGGRKFDESKVKRDGDGQFARAAGLSAKTDQVPTAAQRADAEWKAGLDDNRELQKATWHHPSMLKNLINKRREIYQRTGIDPGNTLGSKSPKAVAARTEFAEHIVTSINKLLATTPAAVSPSGTERVRVVYNSKTGHIDYAYDRVSVKHSDMAVVELRHGMSIEEIIALLDLSDELDDEELQHALEAGSSGPVKKDAPKGDGKGGGRKFDESKVKRDGDGQFARVNGRPDPVSPDLKAMDAAWKNNIGKNDALIDVLYGDGSVLLNKVESKVTEIKRRTGVDLSKAISDLGEAPPKVTRAATELMSYMATETNKILATSPAAVSPSKTQRVQYRLVNPNTDAVDIKLVYVPNKLKHDDLNVDSFMQHEEEGELLGGWRKVLAALDENSLAHVGVKGMKWGVRKSRSNVKKSTSSGKGSSPISSGTRVEAKSALKDVGKVALKYGAPLAVGAAVGAVAAPLGVAAVVSTKVLSDPMAQAAIKAGASATKDLLGEFGDIKMPDLPKVSNPFGQSSTTSNSQSITNRTTNTVTVEKDSTSES